MTNLPHTGEFVVTKYADPSVDIDALKQLIRLEIAEQLLYSISDGRRYFVRQQEFSTTAIDEKIDGVFVKKLVFTFRCTCLLLDYADANVDEFCMGVPKRWIEHQEDWATVPVNDGESYLVFRPVAYGWQRIQ